MQTEPPDTSIEPHCVQQPDESLTLFHLQMKSTHNSYHVEPEGNEIVDWSYTMPPLDVQLGALGVRHFELDVHYDEAEDLLRVFHLRAIDFVSTCDTLNDCLTTMRGWSADNPQHHTIFVHIELKDPLPGEDETRFALIEDTITGAWSRSCIVTPDDVRGDHADLRDAVAEGWPNLGATRGKLMLTLLDRSAWRNAYTRGESDLEGRLMFAEGAPGDPYAAVMRADNPIDDAAEIDAALAANMLVRTRADSGSAEAIAEDTMRLEAGLASGAHMVSTDYPGPVPEHNYHLDIPGGTPSRCNPLTAPADCVSQALEDLSL